MCLDSIHFSVPSYLAHTPALPPIKQKFKRKDEKEKEGKN